MGGQLAAIRSCTAWSRVAPVGQKLLRPGRNHLQLHRWQGRLLNSRSAQSQQPSRQPLMAHSGLHPRAPPEVHCSGARGHQVIQLLRDVRRGSTRVGKLRAAAGVGQVHRQAQSRRNGCGAGSTHRWRLSGTEARSMGSCQAMEADSGGCRLADASQRLGISTIYHNYMKARQGAQRCLAGRRQQQRRRQLTNGGGAAHCHVTDSCPGRLRSRNIQPFSLQRQLALLQQVEGGLAALPLVSDGLQRS